MTLLPVRDGTYTCRSRHIYLTGTALLPVRDGTSTCPGWHFYLSGMALLPVGDGTSTCRGRHFYLSETALLPVLDGTSTCPGWHFYLSGTALLPVGFGKSPRNCKTGKYNPNQDALHQLPRHQQTIFCLRAGHCRLNSHLQRIGVKTSAQYPCGEADETPEYYLQSCSLYHQARQQIWPTCVSIKTKLWGSAEDLFLTSKYAALMGERI